MREIGFTVTAAGSRGSDDRSRAGFDKPHLALKAEKSMKKGS
jgi:hypothetical protein